MSGISNPLSELSPAKRKLFFQRLKEDAARAHQTVEALPIPKAPREQPLALSYAQQRLWFLDQLSPCNPIYNISGVVRLIGALNLPPLIRRLGEIIQRHEALRSIFPAVNGMPKQKILQLTTEAEPLRFSVIDLQELIEDEREADVLRIATKEAQEPFNLTQGPLFRCALLRLSADQHVLLLTMHHIISDGWSIGVFMRELAALYAAFSKGEPAPLPELSIQYADFAHWQRQSLQGQVIERLLSYWKQQLAGLQTLELPTDRARPAVESFRGRRKYLPVSKALTDALKSLSHREGVTLFMTLSAAFKVLLHRYSGQSDIVVGTAIANRNRSEIEGLIGFFVNSLVMRTDLSGDPDFVTLLS